jgi:DNA-binding SARP family transcriptional activator/ABC-type branched-subunit amino acid transport system substrate-binding protein/DNA-binding beta-propeller fold protein YncE
MEFRILGPVEAHNRSGPIRLGGPQQRALLALLLLHRGEAIPTDRLVDALWSERAPPAAVKTVQTYISQLRKALGDGVVVTRGRAYALDAPPGSVDVERFELLVAEARDLLGAGQPESAAQRLRAALALWRGPALADIAYEPFAQREIARLEELRISAIEDRIDAELAAGRSVEVVAELEALVRQHPLRERLRAQLMLALYRSGRQADALDAYRDTRRRLTEELGLEPGRELRELERAILTHDPALGARRRAPSARAARWRPGVLLGVGGALVLIAALAAVLVSLGGGQPTARLASLPPNSLGVIDPRSGDIVASLPVGDGPVAVAVGDGDVWVANGGDQTVSRIDPRVRELIGTVGTGRVPADVTVGGGAVWVANATTGTALGTVSRIEPLSRAANAIRVRDNVLDDFAPATPSVLAIGAGRVWTNHVRNRIASFAIGRERSVHRFGIGAEHSVDGLVVAAGSLWVASSATDRVFRIDPTRRTVVAEIPIAAAPGQRVAGPYGLAAGFGSIWVADSLAGAVTRVDPRLNAVTATIRVGRRPTRLAAGEGAVWVLSASDSTVSRIDPRTNAVGPTIRVGGLATDVAAGAGAVWVTVAGGTPAPSAVTAPAVARPLPADACSPVVTAPGAPPRYLIAADLPRRLGGRHSRETASMAAAVRLVLEERGFRAGRHRIGLQVCDASSRSEGDTDPERCSANARAYAHNPSVIGIVGPYHSWCTSIELPILNSAPGGPVSAVSPSNTYVGLTHSGPETTADEPDRYRPTGTPAYARTVAPDDAQGAALATLARELGVRSLFLLHDETGYGYGLARYVGEGARRLGVRMAGMAGWDPERPHYRNLATTVRRSGADGVLLAGCICSNGTRLLADLRARVGPRSRVLLNDAWMSFDREMRHVARAAQGAYMTTAGIAPERLPAAGRAFAGRLRDVTGVRGPLPAYAITAAQAAQALVDAIARSDGTRPSVAAALRRTHIRQGLLGEIGFDEQGDPVHRPFTVFRFDFRQPPMQWGDLVQDTLVDRIVTPRRELVQDAAAAAIG